MIDLSNKKFPDREKTLEMKRNGGEIASSAYETFVTEGSMYVRSINCNNQMRAIDFYSSNITALLYKDKYIFGATSGEKSVIFMQVLQSAYDCAAPVWELREAKETVGLASKDRGVVLTGSNTEEKGCIIEVSRIGGYGDVIQEWGFPIPEEKTLLYLDEKIRTFKQSDKDKNKVFVITESGKFCVYDVEKNEIKEIGLISKNFFSNVVCEGKDETVYLFKELGHILVYKNNELKETEIKIPCFPGKGPYAKISACVYDEKENSLIVGDTEGLVSKVIFENPETGEETMVIPMGKPTSVGGVDFLCQIVDGRIFGVAGSKEGMAHLFEYNKKYHSLKDLGVCCATVEKGWYGYVFGAMLSLPDGHIVLGENDRLGCLFHYYPTII